MPEDFDISAPPDGMSDEAFLDAAIASAQAGESTETADTGEVDGEASTDTVIDAAIAEEKAKAGDVPADEKPAETPKPAEAEAKPDEAAKSADEKSEIQAEIEDEDAVLSAARIQQLEKSSPEFKALLAKQPGLRNQLFASARRAERAGQYDEMFQTPALAKVSKTAAEDRFLTHQLYTSTDPADSMKFLRKLMWDDIVKDEAGNPKTGPDGRPQFEGHFDRHMATYRKEVYSQIENLSKALQAQNKNFFDADGNEILATDLVEAMKIVRAAVDGVGLGKASGATGAQPATTASLKEQQLQAEVEQLRAESAARKQAETVSVGEFRADAEKASEKAIETDTRNLLNARLPKGTAFSDYMKDVIVRETVGEIKRLSEANAAYQDILRRSYSALPRNEEGRGKIVAQAQGFAKELIPRILARVISKAAPGVVASNKTAQTKIAGQQSRREVASSGGVPTPSRPDAGRIATDAIAAARKQGKYLSDEALADAVMAGMRGSR